MLHSTPCVWHSPSFTQSALHLLMLAMSHIKEVVHTQHPEDIDIRHHSSPFNG